MKRHQKRTKKVQIYMSDTEFTGLLEMCEKTERSPGELSYLLWRESFRRKAEKLNVKTDKKS